MKLAIAHTFASPPEQVFAALIDPAALQRSIDGCEKMVKTGDDAYEAHLKVGLGTIKGSYRGKIRITAQQPPQSLTLAIDGNGIPGFVKATVLIRLVAKGDQTELSGEADATVGGLIAAVGSRLIETAAKKMTGDFFTRLAAEIISTRSS